MLTTTPSVPEAPSVGHDALEAAKPLLLLQWPEVACLAARVALERRVQAAIDEWRLRKYLPPVPRLKFYHYGRAMHRKGYVSLEWYDALASVHSELSKVAHGGAIRLIDAAALIESAEWLAKTLGTEPRRKRRNR